MCTESGRGTAPAPAKGYPCSSGRPCCTHLARRRYPLQTLLQSDPAAVYDNTTLLAALGSSQTGIKYAVQHDLFHLAEGLPPELLHEPGLSHLAAAVEAYHLFSPAVWLVQQVNAWKQGGQKVADAIPGAPQRRTGTAKYNQAAIFSPCLSGS